MFIHCLEPFASFGRTRNFRSTLFLPTLFAATFMLAIPSVRAQTAYFSGVVNTLSIFSSGVVAVDGSGNVFVTGNNAVYEVIAVNGSIPASPTIRTLSSGISEPNGLAVDRSGNVFVTDGANGHVEEIIAVGGSIPASPTIRTWTSGFSAPTGVAVDGSGNVFVADQFIQVVDEMIAVGGSIPASPTIRQWGSGFSTPVGVAVDGSGNVFVADTGNNAVYEMIAVNGSIPASPTILTLGSGFFNPFGVAVDGNGNVFVAVNSNTALKEISPANFGSVAVGAASAQQSLTFAFDTGGTLASTPYSVLTQGAPNLDFAAAATQPATACVTGHPYNAGDTCTVDVVFTPSSRELATVRSLCRVPLEM